MSTYAQRKIGMLVFATSLFFAMFFMKAEAVHFSDLDRNEPVHNAIQARNLLSVIQTDLCEIKGKADSEPFGSKSESLFILSSLLRR